MRTPKEYTDNLKKGIITMDMLAACLFSVNKRAKNCRDKEREYREFYRTHRRCVDYYGNVDNYQMKKEYYYIQKDKLLAVVEPTCIHAECSMERVRFYDYEDEYFCYFDEDNYVRSGSYYDREMHEDVAFIDVMLPSSECRYYLFYDFGTHSFHSPIEDIEKYPTLKVVNIGAITTNGKDITDLLSTQFVDKVLKVIEAGEFIIEYGGKNEKQMGNCNA